MKKACNFIKKDRLWQHKVFSGEFCKISNNTFFTAEHLQTPDIDSTGFNPGQTCILFSYGFSKNPANLDKPSKKQAHDAGSFKKKYLKSQVFSGFFLGLLPKKPLQNWIQCVWVLEPKLTQQVTCVGSRTQLTELTLDFSQVHLNTTNKKVGFSQKTRQGWSCHFQKLPRYLYIIYQ